ncbi:MAG: hypothetical protein PUP46_04540 [Endozoicomonas sp. (ex Botrylloides leachii)]|nr:hypothetical protein [Endozoicomonas sp. (ex Botrylloides leachii)]
MKNADFPQLRESVTPFNENQKKTLLTYLSDKQAKNNLPLLYQGLERNFLPHLTVSIVRVNQSSAFAFSMDGSASAVSHVERSLIP